MSDKDWASTWDALSSLKAVLDDDGIARQVLTDRICAGLLAVTAESLIIWGRAGRFTFHSTDDDFEHELHRELTKHSGYAIEWRVGTLERNSIVHGAKIVGLRVSAGAITALCHDFGMSPSDEVLTSDLPEPVAASKNGSTVAPWSEGQMIAEIQNAVAEINSRDREKVWRESFKSREAESGWSNGAFREVWSKALGSRGRPGRPLNPRVKSAR